MNQTSIPLDLLYAENFTNSLIKVLHTYIDGMYIHVWWCVGGGGGALLYYHLPVSINIFALLLVINDVRFTTNY